MDSFSCEVPNGKYLVKLHFAETFEGISGEGQRVFSYKVQDREFKDFDVWKKAGGANRAYVETVPVEVTDGKLKITFTSNIENPQINAIEIAPQAAAETKTPVGAVPLLQIDAGKVTGMVSPKLYGLMTEEINFSYEGGLYGELIRNRTFKASTQNPLGWSAVGDAKITLDSSQPLNSALNVSLKLDTSKATEASPVGIANGGYWGIPVRPNTTYHASFYARGEHFSGPLLVSLENASGGTVFASKDVPKVSSAWTKYEVTLTTANAEVSKNNRLVISTKQQGGQSSEQGAVWFQNVSLFPPTYKNRPNGNRPDIMQLLADMQPKFLRFPGGNYLEGNSINERFNWKETIGDVAQRPGHRSPWGYWSTDGLGLMEYLQWCEDLDMEPLLAVFAGYSLRRGSASSPVRNSRPTCRKRSTKSSMSSATRTRNGARSARRTAIPRRSRCTTSRSATKTGSTGRGSYDGRFAQFFDAIKAKYPQLQIIATTPRCQVARAGFGGRALLPFAGRNAGAVAGIRQVLAREQDEDFRRRMGHARRFAYAQHGRSARRRGVDDLHGTQFGHRAPVLLCSAFRQRQPTQRAEPFHAMDHGPHRLRRADELRLALLLCPEDVQHDARRRDPRDRFTEYSHPPVAAAVDARQDGPGAANAGRLLCATRDSKSGIIYLKVVNAAGTAQPIRIHVSGAAKVEPEGELVSLAAGSLDDTNSLEHPGEIVPHTETASGLSADFTREFPPYSITVLKLKTK